jgi:acylglycerol lipase
MVTANRIRKPQRHKDTKKDLKSLCLCVFVVKIQIQIRVCSFHSLLLKVNNMSETAVRILQGEEIFETLDGLRLFEQSWLPQIESKAAIIIVHGYAEHCARYGHVASHLNAHGYSVYSFDLRGHGRSEGARSFIRSFDDYLSDLDLFLSRVQRRETGKPIFILGHSMGGAISVLFAISRKPDINGMILSAAALKISDSISPLLVRLSLLIGRLFPKLPTIKLNSSAISRDPEVVNRYDSDPLIYRGSILAGSGAELVLATNRIQAQLSAVSLPLLILHGTGDQISDAEGSRQLYTSASSLDKTIKLYEGFYHEILNEPERAQVLADLVEWLDARSSEK